MAGHKVPMGAEQRVSAAETQPLRLDHPRRGMHVWYLFTSKLYQPQPNDHPGAALDPPDPDPQPRASQASDSGRPTGSALLDVQQQRQRAMGRVARLRVLTQRLRSASDETFARLRNTHEVIAGVEELLVMIQHQLQRAVRAVAHRQDHDPPETPETDCDKPRGRSRGRQRRRFAISQRGNCLVQNDHSPLHRSIAVGALVAVGACALWAVHVVRRLSAPATTQASQPPRTLPAD